MDHHPNWEVVLPRKRLENKYIIIYINDFYSKFDEGTSTHPSFVSGTSGTMLVQQRFLTNPKFLWSSCLRFTFLGMYPKQEQSSVSWMQAPLIGAQQLPMNPKEYEKAFLKRFCCKRFCKGSGPAKTIRSARVFLTPCWSVFERFSVLNRTQSICKWY